MGYQCLVFFPSSDWHVCAVTWLYYVPWFTVVCLFISCLCVLGWLCVCFSSLYVCLFSFLFFPSFCVCFLCVLCILMYICQYEVVWVKGGLGERGNEFHGGMIECPLSFIIFCHWRRFHLLIFLIHVFFSFLELFRRLISNLKREGWGGKSITLLLCHKQQGREREILLGMINRKRRRILQMTEGSTIAWRRRRKNLGDVHCNVDYFPFFHLRIGSMVCFAVFDNTWVHLGRGKLRYSRWKDVLWVEWCCCFKGQSREGYWEGGGGEMAGDGVGIYQLSLFYGFVSWQFLQNDGFWEHFWVCLFAVFLEVCYTNDGYYSWQLFTDMAVVLVIWVLIPIKMHMNLCPVTCIPADQKKNPKWLLSYFHWDI